MAPREPHRADARPGFPGRPVASPGPRTRHGRRPLRRSAGPPGAGPVPRPAPTGRADHPGTASPTGPGSGPGRRRPRARTAPSAGQDGIPRGPGQRRPRARQHRTASSARRVVRTTHARTRLPSDPPGPHPAVAGPCLPVRLRVRTKARTPRGSAPSRPRPAPPRVPARPRRLILPALVAAARPGPAPRAHGGAYPSRVRAQPTSTGTASRSRPPAPPDPPRPGRRRASRPGSACAWRRVPLPGPRRRPPHAPPPRACRP